MKSNRLLIIIAVFLIISPLFYIPAMWRNVLLILAGILIMAAIFFRRTEKNIDQESTLLRSKTYSENKESLEN